MTASADHLTEMLRGLRLDGVDYSRCQLAAPWGIVYPPTHQAYFHFISRGSCWLNAAGAPTLSAARRITASMTIARSTYTTARSSPRRSCASPSAT